MNYFESLSKDMTTLGLMPNSLHAYVFDYLDTKIVAEKISHELHLNKREVEATSLSDLSTEFARRALFLTKAGVVFDNTYEDCCEEAEPKLLQAIDPEKVANPQYNSPIVVTAGNEPVGIIKQYGIRSMYGIQDIPEHNIIRGAFHKINESFRDSLDLPTTEHAWTVPIDHEYSPLTVTPVRFSVFNIPLDERLKMVEYEKRGDVMARLALEGSDTEILYSVVEAFQSAEPMTEAKKSIIL